MSARNAAYLDFNAGSPLSLGARTAIARALGFEGDEEAVNGFGVKQDIASPAFNTSRFLANASSIHSHGRLARRLLSDAREAVALSLSPVTDPEEIVFTSSGTEANQVAVETAFRKAKDKFRWVTTSVEHDSHIQLISVLRARGATVEIIPVNDYGALDLSRAAELITPSTSLVSALWVNNETGVITDIAALEDLCTANNVPLHIDAAQAWGKIPIDLHHRRISTLTLSAHKIGGLAGCGVIWSRSPIGSVILGKQERGRRGGTENLLGAIACGGAAKSINPGRYQARVRPLRDHLELVVQKNIPSARINGIFSATLGVLNSDFRKSDFRVCNTTNLSFVNLDGESLVMAMDLAGYAVSSGSACASGVLEPSHVLMAMGRSKSEAKASLRISLGEISTEEECRSFAVALTRVVDQVSRKNSAEYDIVL